MGVARGAHSGHVLHLCYALVAVFNYEFESIFVQFLEQGQNGAEDVFISPVRVVTAAPASLLL